MTYRKGDLVNICDCIAPQRARVDSYHGVNPPWIEFTYVESGKRGAIYLGYVRPVSPLILLAECSE